MVTALERLSKQGVSGRVFAVILSPITECVMAVIAITSLGSGIGFFLVGIGIRLFDSPDLSVVFLVLSVTLPGVASLMCVLHAMIEWSKPIMLRRANDVIDVMRVLDSCTGGD